MTLDSNSIKKQRPTSPHLSIYRFQISSVLSVFHRISGMILFGFFSILAWWMIFLINYDFCPCLIKILDYKIIWLGLFLSSWAGIYHACNGIRHLIWDTGRLFSINQINTSGWLVVLGSSILTIIFWWMIL